MNDVIEPRAQLESSTMQEDLAEILRTVGLSDGARPYSPHEVVHQDLLPHLRRMRLELLVRDMRRIAHRTGSLSALWDVIFDVEAFVSGRETLIVLDGEQWIAECEKVLKEHLV